MLKIMTKRISLWWRFKQLDRTYQPLLEKAVAFENRDALLKLEEQYWYQTACLLEERRELRKARAMGNHTMTATGVHPGNPTFLPQGPRGRFGSEREITYQHRNAAWRLIGWVLITLGFLGMGLWFVLINPSTRIVALPGLF